MFGVVVGVFEAGDADAVFLPERLVEKKQAAPPVRPGGEQMDVGLLDVVLGQGFAQGEGGEVGAVFFGCFANGGDDFGGGDAQLQETACCPSKPIPK